MLTIEQKLIELGFTQDGDYLDESITRDLVGDTLLGSHGWLVAEDDCTMDIWAFSPNDEAFYYPVYERMFERDNIVDQIKQYMILFFKDENQLELSLF